MAKNKLSDLNDHLFEQLERLNDESLSEEQLLLETTRSAAMVGVSKQIINNAKITLSAMKLMADGRIDSADFPESFPLKKIKS